MSDDFAKSVAFAKELRQRQPSRMGESVMSRPPEPQWQPEYQNEPPLESVSPEDWIPNPKSAAAALAGALKGAPMLMGALDPKRFLRMLPAGSEHAARIAKGEAPESVFRELGAPTAVRKTFSNNPVRYETSRPLYDKNVVHYDAAGGRQMANILAASGVDSAGENLTKKTMARNDASSRLRVGDYSLIDPRKVSAVEYDPWMGGPSGKPDLKDNFQFYVNEFEGKAPSTTGMRFPSVKDILNDPMQREAWNLSLAAPADSQFHQLARILRSK